MKIYFCLEANEFQCNFVLRPSRVRKLVRTNQFQVKSTKLGTVRKFVTLQYCIVLLRFVDSPTGLESLIAGISNDKVLVTRPNAHWLMQTGGGGGGGVSVINGKKRFVLVFFPVLRKGLWGSELGWISTAVSVEENSKGELSYRRRNAGCERRILFRLGKISCRGLRKLYELRD